MVYITGDTHGDFGRFYALRRRVSLSREDIVVILGDAGLNFYGMVFYEKQEFFV